MCQAAVNRHAICTSSHIEAMDVLAFDHLVEFDYETELSLSGILLSGPLPGVIASSDSLI